MAGNVWWSGTMAGTADWNQAGNWTTGTVPTIADSAYYTINNTTTDSVNLAVNIGSGASASAVKLYGSGAGNVNLTLLGTGTLTLGASGIVVNSGRTISLSCDVATSAAEIVLCPNSGGTVTLNSGSTLWGRVTLTGSGTVNLNGNVNAGTNSVAVNVGGGTLNWNVDTFTATSTSGALLYITGRYSSTGTTVVNLSKSFDSAGGITMGFNATVDTNSALFGVANGVTIGDNISTGTAGTGGLSLNSVTLGANDASATAANPTTVTFAGRYTIVDTNARTHNLYAAANNTAVFSGVIAGGSASGSVIKKTGAGTVMMSGAGNTYSSAISAEIVSGTLLLQKSSGVALTSGSVTVDNGGTLTLGAANQISSTSSLFLNGGTFDIQGYTQTVAALQLANGGNVVGSGGTITATSSYDLQSGTVSANLAGTAVVNKTTTSTVMMSGSNTYSGATTISGGELDVNGSLAASSAVHIGSGAVLGGSGVVNGSVNGTDATIWGNGLSIGATTLSGTSQLTGTASASSITVSSGTTSNRGTTVSAGSLHISAGAVLNNAGSASASTVIVENTASLNNNGPITASSINVSGVLSGTGTITGALTIESTGELAPGNSPGTTTVDGSLTVQTGAKVSMQLESMSSYDQIIVNGGVALSGTLAMEISDTFLSEADALSSGTSFILIDNRSGSSVCDTFDALVYATSSGTYTAIGNSFTIGSTVYGISYTGGDGNDVALTVVPEPSTWAMITGGIGLLIGFQRKRRYRVL